MPILYAGPRPGSRDDDGSLSTKKVPGILSPASLRDLLPRNATHMLRKRPRREVPALPPPLPNAASAIRADDSAAWQKQAWPGNAHYRARLRSDAKLRITRGALDTTVQDHVRWIKNNVPVRSLPKLKISNHTKITSLTDVFERLLRHRMQAAFDHWQNGVATEKQAEAVAAFTKSRALGSLQGIWERCWLANRNRAFACMVDDWVCARAEERDAAAAEIQRHWRRHRHRHTLHHSRRDQSVRCIQAHARRRLFQTRFARFLTTARRHRAAVRIQVAYASHRVYRAYMTCSQRLAQEAAAVRLQRWLRTSVYRKQWLFRRAATLRLHDAASVLQRALRAHLARTFLYRARCYKVATRIQRAWRVYIAYWSRRRTQLQDHLQAAFTLGTRHLAAILLQARVRQWIATRCVAMRRCHVAAVLVLQCAWRQCVARHVRTQRLQELRFTQWMAATTVQHCYRRYRDRVLFRHVLATSCVPLYLRAARLASPVQQRLLYSRYKTFIESSASSSIAYAWKKHCRYEAMMRARRAWASSVLQRVWRSTCTVRCFKRHLRHCHRSAHRIQRMVRSRLARNHARLYIARMQKVAFDALVARQNQAALRIQAAWHQHQGHLARFLRKQAELVEHARRHDAAIAIQAFVRSRRARHASKVRLAQGVATIALLVHARHDAATTLQRFVRTRKATKLGRVLMTKLRLQRHAEAQRHKRQAIISAFISESSVARAEEAVRMAAVRANHDKVEAAKARAAAEAAEAKRLRIEASKAKARPPPREYKAKKKTKAQTPPDAATTAAWVPAYDAASGQNYYYNTVTGESKWSLDATT
ncbi:hypothetical protein SPRG_14145 [Saprolegnia parasitica CBS 223.65]|uniref:WW domain-containing protein n=1 Tax=Saprolegnia parasitica (strain CBS 223.65) TaxID=695850 RepID=A0A067BQX1_SAPPC|nr:hypothetical protein SPRG_14145 [Saprolegnia parasitica CBS 223.65]KDO20914.1 hypothetical protein SPRG_14145 [Saprolegnia parasitica CBS 223.65]|eukprot:XP_012208401.1 hypothetical protein SPRG_14145 [Saprolegnia parasitica CBS 223.65]